jgi:dihydrolipoamide dehydrogenase
MVVGELAHERDVIIIGGGPGGYHAAIRAAQLGLSVTLIEKNELGGICLNQGCIPSKVFAHAAKQIGEKQHFEQLGIEFKTTSLNIEKLQNYKQNIIKQLRQGVETLCKANKIELIKGKASFLSEDRLGVETHFAFDVYRFQHVIIATGASLVSPSFVTIDHDRILNAFSIYQLNTVPEHLMVYGNDYISLEVAMSYHAFGSKVTLILEDDFPFDPSINRELQRLLKKRKIKIYQKSTIHKVEHALKTVQVVLITSEGSTTTIEGSHLFVSSRTKSNIEELGIDKLGIKLTETGFIDVNHKGQTSLENIFAIGDVTEGPSLAVKAIKQGKVAAETIAGLDSEVDLTFMPTIVHSIPPIASVGLTEKEAKEQYECIHVGQFPLRANGFASIIGQKVGFIKVLTDAKTDLVVGIHMMGSGAIELISSGIIGLENVVRDEDMKFPLYPHPSINEGLLEAVEALKGEAIHLPPNKQQHKTKVNEAVSQ